MLGSLSRAVFELWAAGLGSDSTAFFGVALYVHLFKTDFTPSLDFDPATATKADFDGYAVQTIASAARVSGYDPSTGELLVIIPPTSAGNHYALTGSTNLPQSIYGGVLSTDSISVDVTKTPGRFKFDSPVELVNGNEDFDLPLVRVRVNPAAVDGM